MNPARILMVEDNEGDVLLTQLALKDNKILIELDVVGDGVEAMDFLLRRGKFTEARRPDLILLDLNLPRMDGREVLAQLKATASLRRIPVVVLTGSDAEKDLLEAYDLHANCYVVKPLGAEEFATIIRSIPTFWLSVVALAPS